MPITIDDGVTKSLSGTGLSLFTGVTVPEGVTLIAGDLDNILFDLPLTSSIVPRQATGSAVATFVRSDPATVKDFEGLVRTALSGEARFQGARRVENLVVSTEDMTNPAYGALGDAVIDNATEVTYDGTSQGQVTQLVTIVDDGTGANARQFVFSVDIKLVSGTISDNSALQIGISGSAVTHVFNNIGSEVTGTVKRFTTLALTDLDGVIVSPLVLWNDPGTLEITRWQLEEISGQSNQNPGDYVSEGVESIPFHGANVDGIQYFETENGNTVINDVVTEAEGSDLTTLKGCLTEEQATNMVSPSEDFNDVAWFSTNASVSVNQGLSPDGKQTANIITFDGNGTVSDIFGTFSTITSGVAYTLSIFVKFDDQQWLQLSSTANFFPDNDYANFDIQNGVLGSSLGMIPEIEAFDNGWYRISATHTANASGSGINPMTIAAIDSSTSLKSSVLTAISTKADIWGGMFSAGVFSYIPTTTAAVTRNADALSYVALDNFDPETGTALATIEALDWNIPAALILGTTSEFFLAADSSDSGIATSDSINTAFGPSGTPSGSIDVAAQWDGGLQAFADGVGGTLVNYGTFTFITLEVGTAEWSGTIKDIKILNEKIFPSVANQLFNASLTSSLVPDFANGSDVATFNRTSIATVKDFAGKIKTAISGESRFQGARRVHNLIIASEDLTNAAYVKSDLGMGIAPTHISGNTYRFRTNGVDGEDRSRIDQRITTGVAADTAEFAIRTLISANQAVTGSFGDEANELVSIAITTTPQIFTMAYSAASTSTGWT
ncbi:MAG: hypothetical protein V3U84_07500, partial [Thiotrichaceae bacterium]